MTDPPQGPRPPWSSWPLDAQTRRRQWLRNFLIRLLLPFAVVGYWLPDSFIRSTSVGAAILNVSYGVYGAFAVIILINTVVLLQDWFRRRTTLQQNVVPGPHIDWDKVLIEKEVEDERTRRKGPA